MSSGKRRRFYLGLNVLIWFVQCLYYNLCWIKVSVSRCGLNQVSMEVVDGMLPIWHQDICTHHDDVGRSAYIKSSSLYVYFIYIYIYVYVCVCALINNQGSFEVCAQPMGDDVSHWPGASIESALNNGFHLPLLLWKRKPRISRVIISLLILINGIFPITIWWWNAHNDNDKYMHACGSVLYSHFIWCYCNLRF